MQAGSGIAGNPDPTATTFANPVGSSVSGQDVTLTATVKATGSGVSNPTDGSVSFYQGATLLGTVPLERLRPGDLLRRPAHGGYVSILRGL